jgi:hypothetical protein
MSIVLGPQEGDLILRGTMSEGFALIDAITSHVIAGPGLDLQAALAVAGMHARGDIWQQHLDARGRPIGAPYRLSAPPE